MIIDAARAIGAVTRKLFTRDYDGRPARVLVATRVYDTSSADLWDALTNPERLPRWFLPVSGEFRLGGQYRIEGNASGEITGCTPPRHLALTWGMHGQVSWVKIDLTEEAENKTLLVLEHIAHVPDDFWDQYGPGAVGVGWDLALFGLDQHIVTQSEIDPQAAAAWTTTEAGQQFVRGSSAAWCDASVSAGTDSDAARAAADRTTAFYVGAAPEG